MKETLKVSPVMYTTDTLLVQVSYVETIENPSNKPVQRTTNVNIGLDVWYCIQQVDLHTHRYMKSINGRKIVRKPVIISREKIPLMYNDLSTDTLMPITKDIILN